MQATKEATAVCKHVEHQVRELQQARRDADVDGRFQLTHVSGADDRVQQGFGMLKAQMSKLVQDMKSSQEKKETVERFTLGGTKNTAGGEGSVDGLVTRDDVEGMFENAACARSVVFHSLREALTCSTEDAGLSVCLRVCLRVGSCRICEW